MPSAQNIYFEGFPNVHFEKKHLKNRKTRNQNKKSKSPVNWLKYAPIFRHGNVLFSRSLEKTEKGQKPKKQHKHKKPQKEVSHRKSKDKRTKRRKELNRRKTKVKRRIREKKRKGRKKRPGKEARKEYEKYLCQIFRFSPFSMGKLYKKKGCF